MSLWLWKPFRSCDILWKGPARIMFLRHVFCHVTPLLKGSIVYRCPQGTWKTEVFGLEFKLCTILHEFMFSFHMLLYANWLLTNEVIAIPVINLGSLQFLWMGYTMPLPEGLTFSHILYIRPCLSSRSKSNEASAGTTDPPSEGLHCFVPLHGTYFLPGHNLLFPEAAQDALHTVGAP